MQALGTAPPMMYPHPQFIQSQPALMPMTIQMQPPNPEATKGVRQKISTAGMTLGKMPSKHKIDIIQSLVSDLDSTLTGNLPQDDLSIILYLITHTHLNMRLNELRVVYYDEVSDKLQKASNRLHDKNPPAFRFMTEQIKAILDIPNEDERSDALCDLALEHNFHVEWLQKRKGPAQTMKRGERMMERSKFKRPRTSEPADQYGAEAAGSNPAGKSPVGGTLGPETVASRLGALRELGERPLLPGPELLQHATVAQSAAHMFAGPEAPSHGAQLPSDPNPSSPEAAELRTIPAAQWELMPPDLQGSLAQQQMPPLRQQQPPRVDACRPQSAASAASEAPQQEVQPPPFANPAQSQSLAAELRIIPPGHDMPWHPAMGIPQTPGFQASVAQQQTGQPQPPQVTLAQSTGSSPTAVAPRVPGAHAGPAPLWQATLPPQPEGANPPQPAASEGQLQQAAALSPSAQGPESLAPSEALTSNETTPSVLMPRRRQEEEEASPLGPSPTVVQRQQPREELNHRVLCMVCGLPEPSMDGPGKPEGTECACLRCLVCKELLREDQEVETLACKHALHKACLDRYSEITGMARADCCPLKCGQSRDAVADSFLSLATSSQVSQEESLTPAEGARTTEDAGLEGQIQS